MIYDSVENADRYGGPDSFIAKAAAAALAHRDKAPGRYELDGDDMYLMVLQYTNRLPADGQWETHRDYIDVQFPVSASERTGIARARDLRVIAPYDPAGDAELALGEGDFICCGAGEFVVFYPGEPHMPGICTGTPTEMTRVVVKVRAEEAGCGL